jgi:hypothetical protein
MWRQRGIAGTCKAAYLRIKTGAASDPTAARPHPAGLPAGGATHG